MPSLGGMDPIGEIFQKILRTMKGHEGLHAAGSGRFFVAFFVCTRGFK